MKKIIKWIFLIGFFGSLAVPVEAKIKAKYPEISAAAVDTIKGFSESASDFIGSFTGTKKSDGTAKKETDTIVKVLFVDVGQGDATLIESDGHAMLIDAGTPDKGTLIRNTLKKRGVKKLDYLILTHPDADHIGGAASVIYNVPIEKVFMPDVESDSKTYRRTIEAMDAKSIMPIYPTPSAKYTLGKTEFIVLAPLSLYEDNNNNSLCIKLYAGETSFLFIGDAEEQELKDITKRYKRDLASDVYKVGHHGSYNSSTEEFLKMVDPEYAVISCAEGNDYGHPHASTMTRLLNHHIHVWRTDIQGSIEVSSDGQNIIYDTSPCDDYTSGDGRKKAD